MASRARVETSFQDAFLADDVGVTRIEVRQRTITRHRPGHVFGRRLRRRCREKLRFGIKDQLAGLNPVGFRVKRGWVEDDLGISSLQRFEIADGLAAFGVRPGTNGRWA